MLVLSRKPGEKIYIGTDITLTLVEVNGNRVKIGIDAPDDFTILRAELAEGGLPIKPREAVPSPC